MHMSVAYGTRRDASWQLQPFCADRARVRPQGKACQMISRLVGEKLQIGCPGLATAIATVYPRVQHQRYWMHKMRSILGHVHSTHAAHGLLHQRTASNASSALFCTCGLASPLLIFAFVFSNSYSRMLTGNL